MVESARTADRPRVQIPSADALGYSHIAGLSGVVALEGRGFRGLQVEDSPALTGLDLSACPAAIDLRLRGLCNLRWIRLPAGGVGRIGLDLVENWLSLSISGRYERIEISRPGHPAAMLKFYGVRGDHVSDRLYGVSIMTADQRPVLAGLPDRIVLGGGAGCFRLKDLAGVRHLYISAGSISDLQLDGARLAAVRVQDCPQLVSIDGDFSAHKLTVRHCPLLSYLGGRGVKAMLEHSTSGVLELPNRWDHLCLRYCGLLELDLACSQSMYLQNCPRLRDVRSPVDCKLELNEHVGDLMAAVALHAARPGGLAALLARPRGGLDLLVRLLDYWVNVPQRSWGGLHLFIEHLVDAADYPDDRAVAWNLMCRVRDSSLATPLQSQRRRAIWLAGVRRAARCRLFTGPKSDRTVWLRQLDLYRRCRALPQTRYFRRRMQHSDSPGDLYALCDYLLMLSEHGIRDQELTTWLVDMVGRLDASALRECGEAAPDPQQILIGLARYCRLQPHAAVVAQVVELTCELGLPSTRLTVGIELAHNSLPGGQGLLVQALHSGDMLPARERALAIELLLAPPQRNESIDEVMS